MWEQYHIIYTKLFRSSFTKMVQFSRSVMSDSLRSHVLQHTRFPCPSPTPRTCSNSCLSNWWCHPTISSSIVPFSSRLQSFSVSGSFPMSLLLASGGQRKYWPFSTSRSSEYSWLISFRNSWFELFAAQGTLKSLLHHYNFKASFLPCSACFMAQLSHPYTMSGKTIALTI